MRAINYLKQKRWKRYHKGNVSDPIEDAILELHERLEEIERRAE